MTYLDSEIGYAVQELTDPDEPTIVSQIGFVVVSLTDPAPPSASAIGFTTVLLRPPHHPIGTWDGSGLAYSPILTWNGTDLV